MSVFEIRSTLSHRSLMHRSKYQLASLVLEQCDINARLLDELKELREKLDWSGRRASIPRPPASEAGALPD